MKNYSFSFKLFISFSILLVAITVVYVIVYDNAVMNSSEKEIGKNCIGKLKVAENTVLEFKNAIQRDTIRLSVNHAINALSEVSGYNTNSEWVPNTHDLMKLSDALDVILEAVNTNTRYESIYLYLEDLGYSLTSNQGFVSNDDLKDIGWLKYYNDYKSKGLPLGWIDTRLPYGNNKYADYLASSCIITYVYPLTPYTTTLRGALVVNIREDVLSKLINTNNVNKEGYIFIINNKGNVISHIDKHCLCRNISNIDYIDNIINSKINEGYLITKVDNKNSLVSFYKSQNEDWIYIGVFSLEPLIYSANNIRTNAIYFSILIAVMSIISVYLISKKLCSPVKKLIQDIERDKGINILEAGDEMVILRKAFESLSNELQKNKRNIMQSYLSNLLKGKCMYLAIDDDIVQLDFPYDYFICVAMSIDNYDEFSKKYEVDRQYYLKMLILNIAEQIINSTYNCIGVNMDNGEIALIININPSQIGELQYKLQECFHKIQNETAKIFDYTISVGIGGCYKGDAEIPSSYMEATQALKLRLIYGHGSVIVWNKDSGKHKYYYPTNVEKYILNQIETRNIGAVEETVNQLVDKIKSKEGLSSDNVIQIFNQLIGNTVIKYLTDSNIDMTQVFGSNFNIYNELTKKETLDEIEQWLINIYRTMIEYLSRCSNDRNDNIDRIMDYIQKNYKKDIGIQDIADYVGLSYSHVRKIFKDKTGRNIVDFINNLRIEEAKKILSCTDVNIKDLALSLGYNSDQTFSRIFKKLEGVTPGEYRAKNRVKSV